MQQQTQRRVALGVGHGGVIGAAYALRRRAQMGQRVRDIESVRRFLKSDFKGMIQGRRKALARVKGSTDRRAQRIAARGASFRSAFQRSRSYRSKLNALAGEVRTVQRARSRAGLAALGLGALAGVGYGAARRLRRSV